MTIVWTSRAWTDLDRIHAFLADKDLDAADAAFDSIAAAPRALLAFPRRGSRLSDFEPREVRELRIGGYVLRYELTGSNIFIVRVFHGREDRF